MDYYNPSILIAKDEREINNTFFNPKEKVSILDKIVVFAWENYYPHIDNVLCIAESIHSARNMFEKGAHTDGEWNGNWKLRSHVSFEDNYGGFEYVGYMNFKKWIEYKIQGIEIEQENLSYLFRNNEG